MWSIVGKVPGDLESGEIVQAFLVGFVLSVSDLFTGLAAGCSSAALHALILDVFNPLRCLYASFLKQSLDSSSARRARALHALIGNLLLAPLHPVLPRYPIERLPLCSTMHLRRLE